MRLQSLPSELVLKLLEDVDFRDLLALQLVRDQSISFRSALLMQYLSQTCRHFRGLIADAASMQYTIALAASGMCDGGAGLDTVPSRARLERLKAFEAARTKFVWKQVSCEISPDTASFRVASSISGNTMIYTNFYYDKTTVSVTQMPSPRRGVRMRRWELEFGFQTHEVKIDAAQDLLILMFTSFPPK